MQTIDRKSGPQAARLQPSAHWTPGCKALCHFTPSNASTLQSSHDMGQTYVKVKLKVDCCTCFRWPVHCCTPSWWWRGRAAGTASPAGAPWGSSWPSGRTRWPTLPSSPPWRGGEFRRHTQTATGPHSPLTMLPVRRKKKHRHIPLRSPLQSKLH